MLSWKGVIHADGWLVPLLTLVPLIVLLPWSLEDSGESRWIIKMEEGKTECV